MSSFIGEDKTEWKKTIAVKSRRFDSDTWRGAELWDLLDKDGMPIGATHVRGEKLPHGAYHRVVEIFTVNSKGELLVTKRAPEKKLYPEMWETTGGAVSPARIRWTRRGASCARKPGFRSAPVSWS